MFKNIIEKNIDIFGPIISKLIKVNDYNDITFNNTELPIERYNDYHKIVDFNATVNDNNHLNIELNSKRKRRIGYRNVLYLGTLLGTGINRGITLDEINKERYIQLNLNSNKDEKKIKGEIIGLYNEESKQEEFNGFVKIYYYESYYNKGVLNKKGKMK